MRAALFGGLASAAVAGALLIAPAAHADWNGYCDIQHYQGSGTGYATGWCDGTGPQKYQVGVKCTNGVWYWSAGAKAFGDRTGLSAYCPSGKGATAHTMRRA
ncbi:hypothetical protein [Sphaerisporangium fuscum]|uniref:hypothetical protein n=1 Tax=Sphaerisporangium fuscum TaxID=2835868 RepID=UPI001BDDB3B6|nr:hypothetical protein [Sphaerisporangium fuscum]